MLNVSFENRECRSLFVNCIWYCSKPTYERDNCALNLDLNRIPCCRVDKACAMLAETLCEVGGARFEFVSRAIFFTSQNIYNEMLTF